MKNKAVFFDRDGVINEVIFRDSDKPIAPWSLEEFKLYDDIGDPLGQLRDSGYLLFVVSNQPDISKGLVAEEIVQKMNNVILSQLPIEKVVFCQHEDRHNCKCRKPKPGMLLDLANEYSVDLGSSYMIGDNWKDIDAGKAAGCTTILLEKDYNGSVEADYRSINLDEAVKIIKSHDRLLHSRTL